MTNLPGHHDVPGWDPTSPGYQPPTEAAAGRAVPRDPRMLGALPSPYDARTLRLEDFLVELPDPVPAFTNSHVVAQWDMLGNDSHGCCVVSGYAHYDMLTSQLAGTPNRPTTQEVLDRYFTLTGGADNGLVILDFLRYMRKNPFEGRKLLGYAYVDPRNTRLSRLAVQMFGGLMRGIMLPQTAQTQQVWDVPPDMSDPLARPGSWGGHLTLDTGFGPQGFETVTWGGVQPVSERFYPAYSMESWALIPLYPVPGFDQAKFIQALRDIGSQVDVDPVPVPPPPSPGPTPPSPDWLPDLNTLESYIVRVMGPIDHIDMDIVFAKGRHWPWRGSAPGPDRVGPGDIRLPSRRVYGYEAR